MRTILPATLALLVSACFALVQEAVGAPNPPVARPEIAEPATPDDAVRKALGYLEVRGMAWMRERKCASCHHVPMMIWTMHEAQRHGFAVNKIALAEVRAFALADDNRAKLLPNVDKTRPAAESLSVGTLYAMLGLGAADKIEPSQRGMVERLTKHIREKRGDDGAWPGQSGELLPPINDSRGIITILAALALDSKVAVSATPKDQAQVDQLRKVSQWLEAEQKRAQGEAAGQQGKTSDRTRLEPHHQLLALQLVLRARLGASSRDAVAAGVKQLLAMQNPDGGWSQTKEMPSDAFATGQTLYALGLADVPASYEAIRKARSFLALRQNADGSWPMTSRPRKSTGKPAKLLEPIAYAATAWATLGLLQAAETSARN